MFAAKDPMETNLANLFKNLSDLYKGMVDTQTQLAEQKNGIKNLITGLEKLSLN